MKTSSWNLVWVENMPEKMKKGDLYISIKHNLTEHRCACGCGTEVSLPLGQSEWKIEYDGETISLWPSIGNWRLPCKSHYMIVKNKTEWCKKWSEEKIHIGRMRDRDAKRKYIQRRLKKTALWKRLFRFFLMD